MVGLGTQNMPVKMMQNRSFYNEKSAQKSLESTPYKHMQSTRLLPAAQSTITSQTIDTSHQIYQTGLPRSNTNIVFQSLDTALPKLSTQQYE